MFQYTADDFIRASCPRMKVYQAPGIQRVLSDAISVCRDLNGDVAQAGDGDDALIIQQLMLVIIHIRILCVCRSHIVIFLMITNQKNLPESCLLVRTCFFSASSFCFKVVHSLKQE